jgi:hypothetical protein
MSVDALFDRDDGLGLAGLVRRGEVSALVHAPFTP